MNKHKQVSSKGGTNRMKNLSAKRRKEIATAAAIARWGRQKRKVNA